MSGLAAVIIDTVSIQSYIFSSNKLKENVGASHLVKKIYEIELKEALEKDIRPKLRELGYAPLISYGGSVGSSGKKDTIDIKFIKLK